MPRPAPQQQDPDAIYQSFGKDLYRLTGDEQEDSLLDVINADMSANNSQNVSTSPSDIGSGVASGTTQQATGSDQSGKKTFDNTVTGYILGVDPKDGFAKFYIGNTTNYLNWTGTGLIIEGSITASSINIPDIVTANSFHVDSSGNTWWGATTLGSAVGKVLDTGAATFSNMTITGGAISGASISIGSGNNIFKADANGIYLGNATFASAPYSVSMAGALIATNATITGVITATSGAIGGFTIGTDYISDVANSMGMASTISIGDDIRFWAGSTFANRNTAPFKVTEAGVITATLAVITGALTTAVGSSINGTYITAASIIGTAIANATITSTNIAAATITATQIATGTITGTQIDSATITSSNIATGTILAGNIAAGTITASEISATAGITGGQIASATIVAGNITNLTITAAQIANVTITGAQVAANTITGGASGNIALTSITADNIAANTITASLIAAGTITANEIAANTITANEIAAATITAAKLSSTLLYAGSIEIDTSGNIRSGQTAYETGTGWFIGNSGGAAKFSMGSSTNYLKWDGTYLTLKGSFDVGTNGLINNSSYTVATLPIAPTTVGFNVPSAYE